MEQETRGGLLPSGSLLPPEPDGPLSLGVSKHSMEPGAWRQCLEMQEQVLQAVREERNLRKDWLEELQRQYIGETKKHWEQLMVIVERQGTKQNASLSDFGQQLKEQVFQDVATVHQSLQQSSYHVADKDIVDVQMPPSRINSSVDAEVQTSSQFLDPTANNKRNSREGFGSKDEAQHIYHERSSLEEYLIKGHGLNWPELSDHVDWQEKNLRSRNTIGEGIYHILDSFGFGDGPTLKAPENSVAVMVQDDHFNACCACLIIIHTLWVGIETHIGLTRVLASEDEPALFFGAVDWSFSGIFLIEVFLRIVGLRWWFFLGPGKRWNWFDFALVLISLTNQILKGETFFALRVLRLLRMVRVLRMIRLLKFFKDLRRIVLSVVAAVGSLSWAFALLLLIMWGFSIAIMQTIYFEVKDNQLESDFVDGLVFWYGGMPSTMYTLMRAVSGGIDWNDAAEPLATISGWWRSVFSIFIVFVCFGILNVLTGVFVVTASQITDRDLMVDAEEQRSKRIVRDMKELFHALNADKTGEITWSAFVEYMKDRKLQAYLQAVGLDCSDAYTVFRLLELASESDEVKLEEFVIGCVRVRGQASRMNLLTMSKDLERRDRTLHSIKHGLDQVQTDVNGLLKAFCALSAV